MSVLQLRRDMVVVEDEAVVEIDSPFPLRTIDAEEVAEVREIEDDDHGGHVHAGKSFFQVVRWWFNAAIVAAAVLAYPFLMITSSDVGDRNIASSVDRTRWTAPWAGGAAGLMEKHFNDLGWASDAPGWSPMARLTAKPAYQAAMAGALGEFITLAHNQVALAGQDDPDLTAAARLVTPASTGVQLRAARDALVSYDRRLKRRASAVATTSAQIVEQLNLVSTWTAKSQATIAATSSSRGGSPLDDAATRAVSEAKGRAMAAFTVLDTMHWPDAVKAAPQRAAALAAWKDAAEFHPLIILNGSPDGSLFGNHPATMGFLLVQAQKATDEFIAVVQASAAPAPVIASAVAEIAPVEAAPVESPAPAKAKGKGRSTPKAAAPKSSAK